MRAIIGLGNPGNRYRNTRHNIGFQAVDLFAEKYKISLSPGKGEYFSGKGEIENSPFLIVKPATYMNLSGTAVKDICELFTLQLSDLLIVSDDIHLKTGTLRIRKSGGDGGHNGIKSIIYHLNSDHFSRLRIGVGKEFDEGEQADYVLSKFDKESLREMQPSLDLSVELIKEFIIGGTQAMLNLFSKGSQKRTDSEGNNQRKDN